MQNSLEFYTLPLLTKSLIDMNQRYILLTLISLFYFSANAQRTIEKYKGKQGVYAQNGTELIAPVHEEIYEVDLDTALFITRNGADFQIITINNKPISPVFGHHLCEWTINLDGPISYLEEPDYFPAQVNGKWTFMNLRGDIKKEYSFDEVSQTSVYRDTYFFARDGQSVYLVEGDQRKKLTIENPEFFLGFVDDSELFAVSCKDKIVFLDFEGEPVQLPQDSTQLFVVHKDCQQGLINQKGKILIPYKYDEIHTTPTHIIVVQNKKCALFSTEGKQLSKFKYEDIDRESCDNGNTFIYSNNDRLGLLDAKGKEKCKAKFEYISIEDGYKPTEKNDKYGFITPEGKWAISPKFDYVVGFEDNDRAPVKMNGLWGYCDRKGKIVVPCKYKYAYSFKNGKAKVKTGDKIHTINTSGEQVK